MILIDYFLEKYETELLKARPGSWGLLCNQTSWSLRRRAYLFEVLHSYGVLRRVFLPEHGLFAELQDQVGLDDTSSYTRLASDLEFVSLYGSREESLIAESSSLADLDVLVVDVQDVGSRYYTFATTLAYLLEKIARLGLELRVLVLERPNPAGPWIEGTLLPASHESFVGFPGLVHRHGLTIGELALYYKEALEESSMNRALSFSLEVVFDPEVEPEAFFPGTWQEASQQFSWQICSSPNMPTPITPFVYSGQCLLEGTNLSEGRGTTRPFEIFGAPWVSPLPKEIAEVDGAILRPLRFIPTFHKHAERVCDGWQIHPDGGPYHSLLHTLRILRYLRESCSEFAWRSEEYEFRSDRPAIELLAGDPLLLDYLEGRMGEGALQEYLRENEEKWLKTAKEFRIHKAKRFVIK